MAGSCSSTASRAPQLAFEPSGHINCHPGDFESYQVWREEWKQREGFTEESKAGKYRRPTRN